MTRGKARTPRTVRKLNIGGGGGSSQPPTGLPSFAKSTLEAYVKASNTGTGDGFGSSVAVDGNTLVVGAPSEDSNATGINGNQANNSASGSGAVYVFTRSNGVWTQQAYLKASNTGVQDHFGTSVALSGETLAVGAPDEDSNAMGINGNQSDNSAENSGAVYIFTRVNGEWHQQAYHHGSFPELISHETTGFLCRDEQEMAQAVRRVGEIDRRRCRRAFEERFTAERMTKEYVQLYERMIREESVNASFSSEK